MIALAHEFWIYPSKFFYAPGEQLLISFMVGENFMGEPWDLKAGRIERLELHHEKSVSNIQNKIVEGVKNNVQVSLNDEGTHMIVFQSNHKLIELESEKFNTYLKEDGLDDVYDQREKTNSLNKIGKERYARYAKLLVQVGKKPDDTFKKEAALPVEIVPMQNPYALKIGDPIQFKILFEGKPLFGAKVRIWNRYNNRTTVQNIFSQQDGMIETHVSNPGAWMVSFVKMVPSKNPEAEWQSYWASLVFGVK
jgi:uncharacterized GH25 family protein